MDEKGFVLGVVDVTKRICPNVGQNMQFKEHRNCKSFTVLEAISFDGIVLTSLIIIKGVNHLADWYRDMK